MLNGLTFVGNLKLPVFFNYFFFPLSKQTETDSLKSGASIKIEMAFSLIKCTVRFWDVGNTITKLVIFIINEAHTVNVMLRYQPTTTAVNLHSKSH